MAIICCIQIVVIKISIWEEGFFPAWISDKAQEGKKKNPQPTPGRADLIAAATEMDLSST